MMAYTLSKMVKKRSFPVMFRYGRSFASFAMLNSPAEIQKHGRTCFGSLMKPHASAARVIFPSPSRSEITTFAIAVNLSMFHAPFFTSA